MKNRGIALALTICLCPPLAAAQPLSVMAETGQMEQTWAGVEKKETDQNDSDTIEQPDGDPLEDVEEEEGSQEERPSEEDTELSTDENEETKATPSEAQEEETEEEEELPPKDRVEKEETVQTGNNGFETATPGNATPSNATPSNALPLNLLAEPLSAGDIWGGYTMSAELEGEGTKEKPYLIRNENDLKYLAYHTAEGNVNGYFGCYFKLTADITLSSGASWIPIGYFWSSLDADAEPFRGNFDGGGHRIKNLNISNSSQTYAGLFGQTMGANIKDVSVSASISAANLCGGIAGEANDTVIAGCFVSGTVKAAGTAGGIVGEGYETVIDDCRNTATVYAAKPAGGSEPVFAGGIIGSAHDSKVINCTNASTESATSIYAEGYVGGIAGNIIGSRIYNSYVTGKIGSISAEAIGGIVGRLESGQVKLARMEGSIGKNTSSGLKWAGLFVGYIVDNATQLGPDKDLAYLYTDDESVYALNPFGNMLNGLIDKTHHIGAYSSTNTVSLYCPVATPKFSLLADTYFYEELENGVLDTEDPEVYHFAPSRTGAPVRGYHISVPSVDHGTLSVIEANNPFAKELNWANGGAVAAGRKLLVYASPVNETDGDEPVYYELVPDSLMWFEEGGSDYGTIRTDSSEVSFMMPEKDIALTAEYRAMTNGVVLDKQELTYEVEQIRSGSRWEPTVSWRVTDPQRLTATILPASAANKEVSWNVRATDGTSTDIITISQEGAVSVNKDAKWIADLVSAAVTNQLTLYPSKPITLEATAYASATVTARANSSRASSLVTVNFKVTDHTVVPVEGVTLNESSIGFEVERVLAGDRLHPEETIRVTPGKRLYASVSPIYSTNRQVDFTKGDGMNDQDMLTLDAEGLVNVNPGARWISDLIAEEENSKKTDPYATSQAGGNRATYITAVTADGGRTAVCAVNVNFKTTDKTVVYAEGVALDKAGLEFSIQVIKDGLKSNPQITYQVTEPQALHASVIPAAADNQQVSWKSGETGLVLADNRGNISVRSEDAWVKDLILKNQMSAQREVPVVVQSEDGGFTATCMVKINFALVDHTYIGGSSGGSGGGGGGGGSSSGPKAGGTVNAGAGPGSDGTETGTWKFKEENQTWSYQYKDGTYAADRWEQIFYNGDPEWYYFGQDGLMKTGWYTDPDGHTFYLYPVADGNRGRMMTGWSLIDGKWYYFNTISDGTRGSLLRNTVTPDNYRVDQDGIWIP